MHEKSESKNFHFDGSCFFAFALPLLVVRKFFGKVIQCMEDQKEGL